MRLAEPLTLGMFSHSYEKPLYESREKILRFALSERDVFGGHTTLALLER
jgi:hypothetical protein